MPDLRAVMADAKRELDSIARTPLARRAIDPAIAAFQPALSRVAERGEYGAGGQVSAGYYMQDGGACGLIRRGTRVACLAGQTAVCLFITLQPDSNDPSVVTVRASIMTLQPDSVTVFHGVGPQNAFVHGTRAVLQTGRLRGRLHELSGGPTAGGSAAGIGVSQTVE